MGNSGIIKIKSVQVSVLWLIGSFLLFTASVIFNLILWKKINPENTSGAIFDLGVELIKTIIIGLIFGYIFERFLELTISDPLKENLERSDIKEIYPSRQDALNRFIGLVQSNKTTKIEISGISLREFLTENGKMRSVWSAITTRLKDEELRKLPKDQRLQVMLLMLDPRSSEGYFRYKVERPGSEEFHGDIDLGLVELERVSEDIYSGNNQTNFQFRLYEYCPFSFMFITNTTCFVEQYFYHNPKNQKFENSFPLFEYRIDSVKYQHLKYTFETIWKNASKERIKIGTAVAIEEAKIKNIFRENKRFEQAVYQARDIKDTSSGTIDILAISGKHFIDDKNLKGSLIDISKTNELSPNKSIKVRVALINPISEQAIYKALSDGFPIEKLNQSLENYSWEKHRASRLYTNINTTLMTIENWINNDRLFEIKLYSCAASNNFLLTENSMYIGHYVYGRSRRSQEVHELKSEYPLIEYSRSKDKDKFTIEQEIIEYTFDTIWNHFSIPYEAFQNKNLKDEFEANLSKIKNNLMPGK